MRRIAILLLSAALATTGCTGPDGRIDPGPTLALTAGIAAFGGLAFLASQDNDRPRHRGGYGGHHGGNGGRRGWR